VCSSDLRHIKDQVTTIKKGDWIYLENSFSKKRWSLYFRANNINEKELNITYITQEEFFKLKNIKFDSIVGNPPFNDDQNLKENNGNYVSASKKIHLNFINKALELSDNVTMVAPVRGWWVGKNKNKNVTHYTNKGLYHVENKGMPFTGSVTGEIGVFYFDKTKEFVTDDFVQEEPIDYSIVDQFKMFGMVGDKTPGVLGPELSDTGIYKVILTSNNIKFTDDDTLFNDKSRGNWRVAFNHNGNKAGKSIYGGKMQVASPTDYLSMSMSCLIVSNEEEANIICDYLTSDTITDIMRRIKVSNTNSKYHFRFVPAYVK
jgi:hypothetical protein